MRLMNFSHSVPGLCLSPPTGVGKRSPYRGLMPPYVDSEANQDLSAFATLISSSVHHGIIFRTCDLWSESCNCGMIPA